MFPFLQHTALWTGFASLVLLGVVAAEKIVGKGKSKSHLSTALRSAEHHGVRQAFLTDHLS